MFAALSLAVALTLGYSSSVTGQDDCPCYPYNGIKLDLICDDPSLTSIPDCVPSDINRLYIIGTSIPIVPETFQRFTNLEMIEIRYYDTLIISSNFLLYQDNLAILYIMYADLDYVDNRWFEYTPELTHVGLAHNKIPSLPVNTFRSLHKLQFVGLDRNNLTTLPATVFEGTSLTEVVLGNNPWHCECELMKLMKWLWDHGVTLRDEPVCYQPLELRGLRLRDLTEELACQH